MYVQFRGFYITEFTSFFLSLLSLGVAILDHLPTRHPFPKILLSKSTFTPSVNLQRPSSTSFVEYMHHPSSAHVPTISARAVLLSNPVHPGHFSLTTYFFSATVSKPYILAGLTKIL